MYLYIYILFFIYLYIYIILYIWQLHLCELSLPPSWTCFQLESLAGLSQPAFDSSALNFHSDLCCQSDAWKRNFHLFDSSRFSAGFAFAAEYLVFAQADEEDELVWLLSEVPTTSCSPGFQWEVPCGLGDHVSWSGLGTLSFCHYPEILWCVEDVACFSPMVVRWHSVSTLGLPSTCPPKISSARFWSLGAASGRAGDGDGILTAVSCKASSA